MYFGRSVLVKKSILDYTWLSMVAEIGGYVGLLLGISLVDIAFSIDRWILWARVKGYLKAGDSILKSKNIAIN